MIRIFDSQSVATDSCSATSFWAGLVLATCPAFAAAATDCDVNVSPNASICELKIGVVSRGQQDADQIVTYSLNVPESSTLVTSLTSIGLDLFITLRRNGNVVLIADSPNSRDGRERFALESLLPGAYQIEIGSKEHTSTRGHHEILVTNEAIESNNQKALTEESLGVRLTGKARHGDSEVSEQTWRRAFDAYLNAASSWASA